MSRARAGAPAARLRAFTLVEMLVVLVVLGIMAAITVVAMAPDERGLLEREATRLAGALEHASASAQWHGETLGISADGPGYRFWRRDGDGEWQVITGDEVLAPRSLPAGFAVRPQSYAGTTVAADTIIPFRPSGRNEPYRLDLVAVAWRAAIDGDPLNRITWSMAPRNAAAS